MTQGHYEYMLEARSIVVDFPGVRALDSVDFDARRGEVHALIGQNGAGKSTLVKVICGVYKPDAGEIFLNGVPLILHHPRDAQRVGIMAIQQDLKLIPTMTVADNILLGREPDAGVKGLRSQAQISRQAEEALSLIGASDIHPRRRVATLTTAQQQLVAIARVVSANARLVIMDEPTSALAGPQVEHLFAVIRRLTSNGVTVIYVSQRLEEVAQIADRVTVLRNGALVATRRVTATTIPELIGFMTGRETLVVSRAASPAANREPILEVERLTVRGKFTDISLTLRKGEIVGIAGLIGSGRSQLLATLFGVRRPDSGTIRLRGREVRFKSPRDAMKHKLAYLPEDRKRQGILLNMSAQDNITLSVLGRLGRLVLLRNRGAESKVAQHLSTQLDVRAPSLGVLAQFLSGGNQQKVLVARWLATRAEIFLLDEPTVGIDVGVRVEIYRLIEQLAAEGTAILFVSSDLDEILNLSHRIVVMAGGRLTGSFDRKNVTARRVLEAAFAAQTQEAS